MKHIIVEILLDHDEPKEDELRQPSIKQVWVNGKEVKGEWDETSDLALKLYPVVEDEHLSITLHEQIGE